MNRTVTLASRPTGEPGPENFALVEAPIPEPAHGEMLLRTLYLSLDPYMRGRMNERASYADPVALGAVMGGATVSEVVESKLHGYKPGDTVLSYGGWQEYSLSDGTGARRLDPSLAPVSAALGVLGMPGLTAYVGLLDIGVPHPGETVVVSAATGAVGSVAGQIAKIVGCRVVGVAGSPEKCEYAVKELGFDDCVSHRAYALGAELKNACPHGVDIYFENVGGRVFEAVLDLLNLNARVPICGQIAHYNATELPPGPNLVPKVLSLAIERRLKFQGFLVSDHFDRAKAFEADMTRWLREGSVKTREDVVEGIENAVPAFLGLLRGANFGKLLVKVKR